MPPIPRPRVSVQPTQGTVGRLRVDAPVEAFTGGAAGLQAVGSAVASAGAAIQQHGKKQEKAAQNRKAQETDLKYRKNMNNFKRAINSWMTENKDSPARSQARDDLNHLVGDLKGQYADFGDKRADEAFKLQVDEWMTSRLSEMDKEDGKFYEAERAAENGRAIDTEADAVIEGADEAIDAASWDELNTDRYDDAVKTTARDSKLGEKQTAAAIEDSNRAIQGAVLNKAAGRIETSLDPDQAAANTKKMIEDSSLLSTQKEKMVELVDASLATRKANDIRAAEASSDSVKDEYVNKVSDPDITIAQLNELYVQAESDGRLNSPSDTEGVRRQEFIKKAIAAKKKPYQAQAEMDVNLALLYAGDKAAAVLNDKMLFDGILNLDQYNANRKRIAEHEVREIDEAYKHAASQIKDIISKRNGTVFAAKIDTEGVLDEPIGKVADFVLGKDSEELKDATFEGLDREIGEGVGKAARFSLYDEYKLTDADMSQLYRAVELHAQANDTRDANKLIEYANKLLFPKKRNLAMMNYQKRIRESMKESRKKRQDKVKAGGVRANEVLNKFIKRNK